MQNFISYLSSFDSTILYTVQSIGPKWEQAAHFLSQGIGSYWIMLGLFFVVLVIIDKWRVAGELLVVTGVSFIVLVLLKHLFAIERPYLFDTSIIQYDTEGTFAFPSGHALMSVVILGWVAFRHPKSHIIVWGAPIIIFLIGLSRVYLGVHYPTQVVAGWFFGLLLLFVFRAVGQTLWAPFQKKL